MPEINEEKNAWDLLDVPFNAPHLDTPDAEERFVREYDEHFDHLTSLLEREGIGRNDYYIHEGTPVERAFAIETEDLQMISRQILERLSQFLGTITEDYVIRITVDEVHLPEFVSDSPAFIVARDQIRYGFHDDDPVSKRWFLEHMGMA